MAAHLEKLGLLPPNVRLLHLALFCYTLFGTTDVAHDHAALEIPMSHVQTLHRRAQSPVLISRCGSRSSRIWAPRMRYAWTGRAVGITTLRQRRSRGCTCSTWRAPTVGLASSRAALVWNPPQECTTQSLTHGLRIVCFGEQGGATTNPAARCGVAAPQPTEAAAIPAAASSGLIRRLLVGFSATTHRSRLSRGRTKPSLQTVRPMLLSATRARLPGRLVGT